MSRKPPIGFFLLGLAESILLSATYKHFVTVGFGAMLGVVWWGLLLFCSGVLAFFRKSLFPFWVVAASGGIFWGLAATHQLRLVGTVEGKGELSLPEENLVYFGAMFLALLLQSIVSGRLLANASQALRESSTPHWSYAILVAGFMVGGPGAFYSDRLFGHLVTLGVGVLGAVALAVPWERGWRIPVTSVAVAACLGGVLWLALPSGLGRIISILPFTVTDHLGGEWSPYHRVDFWDTEEGCLVATYDGIQMWFTCPPEKLPMENTIPYGTDLRILSVGSGGGSHFYSYLKDGPNRVDAVELDPVVVETVKGRLSDYTGGYTLAPTLDFRAQEARSFLERLPDGTFDLVHYEGVDTFRAVFQRSVVPAPSFLFTREALSLVWSKLKDDGILLANFSTTAPEMMAAIIESLPSDEHLALFRPKGLEAMEIDLTVLIAAKNAAALDRFLQGSDDLPFVERLPLPAEDVFARVRPLTDNAPHFGNPMFIAGLGAIMATLTVASGFGFGRRKGAGVGRVTLWLVAGATSMALEILVISRAAGAFGDPATGGVWLISCFLASSGIAVMVLERWRSLNALIGFVAVAIGGMGLLVYFSGFLLSVVQATGVALVTGFASSLFWAYSLRSMPSSERGTNYLLDILGSAVGVFVIHIAVSLYGFRLAAALAGVTALLLWAVMLRAEARFGAARW